MSITPPPGFADRTPARGQWHDPGQPPAEFTTPEILLPGGAVTFATWTGAVWWRGAEYRPLGWRLIPEIGMSAGAAS